MPNISRPQNEIEAALREQFNLLSDACILYDSGHLPSRLTISVVLRNLLKTKGNTVSLLEQFCKEQTISLSDLDFIDTSDPDIPGAFCHWHIKDISNCTFGIGDAYMGLVEKWVDGETGTPRLHFKSFAASGVKTNLVKKAFGDWYGQIIYKDDTHSLTRQKLIACIAEQDGGAHFDNKLDEDYALFRENNALHLILNGQEAIFENNPAFESLRQIAQEVLESLQGLI